MITIKKLKEAIKDLDNDMMVVVSAFDHSYEQAYTAHTVEALVEDDGHISEAYDEDESNTIVFLIG